MENIENSLSRKAILFSLVSFATYWFANAVLWIPWIINKWLGITVMIILVPFLWGLSSIYCLKYSPIEKWSNIRWLISSVFLVISIVSDYFFFVVWRGVPEQLYHPTTFAAYALILIMPLIMSKFDIGTSKKETKIILNKNLAKIGLLGLVFFILTLYSVRFW